MSNSQKPVSEEQIRREPRQCIPFHRLPHSRGQGPLRPKLLPARLHRLSLRRRPPRVAKENALNYSYVSFQEPGAFLGSDVRGVGFMDIVSCSSATIWLYYWIYGKELAP
jgi:hypothetical protein